SSDVCSSDLHYYGGNRYSVRPGNAPTRIAARSGYNTRVGNTSRVTNSRVARDRNGRIVTGRSAATTRTTRSAVGNTSRVRTENGTVTRGSSNRPTNSSRVGTRTTRGTTTNREAVGNRTRTTRPRSE